MRRYDQFTLDEVEIALTYDDINIVPEYSNIASRKDVSVKTRLVGDVYLDTPVVPANMDSITDIEMMIEAARSGSIAFLHRFMTIEETLEKMEQFYAALQFDYLLYDACGISVGTGSFEHDRAAAAIELWSEMCEDEKDRLVIMIDVAHGDHEQTAKTVGKIHEMIAKVGESSPNGRIFIIAGNIATYGAAVRLIGAGADGLKVGVGNGSLCETRIRTGIGVPQVSAILEVLRAKHYFTGSKVTIMADGGVKYPGDVAKALWLGANSVMSGYMFAGTLETPGTVMKRGLFPNEKEFKIYRGSASMISKADRGETANVEGNVKEVPVKGPAHYIFTQIREGLQSGFSYVGARDLRDFRRLGKAVQITSNGVIEARPNFIEQ